MATTTRYLVRPMTAGDIPQVAEIEREAFPTTWPPTAYRRELNNRLARYFVVSDRAGTAPGNLGRRTLRRSFVDVILGRPAPEPTTDHIVGYVGLWLMVDQAHIVAIAVRPAYRGHGLGELLMVESIEAALASGVDSVTLEVRRSNESARKLYEKYGFLMVGVRKGYYSDNREDAVVMTTPPMRAGYYLERFERLKAALEQRLGGEIDAES